MYINQNIQVMCKRIFSEWHFKVRPCVIPKTYDKWNNICMNILKNKELRIQNIENSL